MAGMGQSPRGGSGGGMGDWLRENKSFVMAAGAGLLLIVSVGFGLKALMSGSPASDVAKSSRYRTLVDSETNDVFKEFKIPEGSKWPLKNPKTGTLSLYPAEACYWTTDGKYKEKPTWVFLRAYTQGLDAKTVCPDCGRPVVGHNPMPPVEIMLEAARAKGKG